MAFAHYNDLNWMRCLSCKYDLSHIAEHRCPECGREFDPSDPRTYDGPHRSEDPNFPIGKAAQMKIGIALGVIPIALGIGQLIFIAKPMSRAIFSILCGAGLIAVFYILLKRYSKYILGHSVSSVLPLMRCLSCRYDLQQLTAHRCPECGREFDPDDPTTFFDESLQRKRRRIIWIFMVSSYMLSIAICYILLDWHKPSGSSDFEIFWISLKLATVLALGLWLLIAFSYWYVRGIFKYGHWSRK